MKTFAKVSLIVFLCLCMQSTVYADCPDGHFKCPLTGKIVVYGQHYNPGHASCDPYNNSYKDKCNEELHNRWMTNDKKIKKSSLSEITIPGAHDAGMGRITSCSKYANANVTQTQDRSFFQMLNSGIRYFDIRPVIMHNGKMFLGHYSWIGMEIASIVKLRNEGCTGYSIDEMLSDVKKFVSSSTYNREVIVLNISHFMNFKKYDNENSHFDKKDLDLLKNKIVDKLNGYLVKNNTHFLKTPIDELTGTGPKVIVIFDADGYDCSEGIYSQKYLNLYDEYSNTESFDGMKHDQFKKMNDYSSCKYYFILSWTLTLSQIGAVAGMIPGSTGIHTLAYEANTKLHEIAEHSISKRKYPNVIYADFVSGQLTKTSILINRYR